MTRQQKEKLASKLISQAANMLEFWDELDMEDMDRDEAAVQLAKWLAKLPGTEWDNRLPNVK